MAEQIEARVDAALPGGTLAERAALRSTLSQSTLGPGDQELVYDGTNLVHAVTGLPAVPIPAHVVVVNTQGTDSIKSTRFF